MNRLEKLFKEWCQGFSFKKGDHLNLKMVQLCNLSMEKHIMS